MTTALRCMTLCLICFFFATSAEAFPPPIHISFTDECEGLAFQVKVWVENWSGEDITVSVRRTETAPDMLGEAILAEGVFVAGNQLFTMVLPDPGIGPGDMGYYMAEVFWPDGSYYGTFEEQLSCAENPYLMRGWLLDESTFQPCTSLGLLECETVTLMYPDLIQYVGTWELLEIHGWPYYLDARDDCWIQVEEIVSLGVGTLCEDVVSQQRVTWGTLKASYR